MLSINFHFGEIGDLGVKVWGSESRVFQCQYLNSVDCFLAIGGCRDAMHCISARKTLSKKNPPRLALGESTPPLFLVRLHFGWHFSLYLKIYQVTEDQGHDL